MDVASGVIEVHPVRPIAVQTDFASASIGAIDAEFEAEYPFQTQAVNGAGETHAAQCDGLVEALDVEISAYFAADHIDPIMGLHGPPP